MIMIKLITGKDELVEPGQVLVKGWLPRDNKPVKESFRTNDNSGSYLGVSQVQPHPLFQTSRWARNIYMDDFYD